MRVGFFDMTNLPDCLEIVRAIPPPQNDVNGNQRPVSGLRLALF